jgi:hypothetical protein
VSAHSVDVLAVFDDELIKSRMRGDAQGHAHLLAARQSVAALISAARNVIPYIATQTIGCHGSKCREPWCYSCYPEDEAAAEAQKGATACGDLREAISAVEAQP